LHIAQPVGTLSEFSSRLSYVSLVFPAAILYQWQLVVLPSCARSSTPNIPPPHQQLAFAGTKKVALSPSFILSATITPWSPIPDPDQVLSIGSSVGRQPRTDLADRGPGPFKHYGRPRCHCTSCPTRVNCSSAISVVIGPLAPYVCIAWGVGDKKVALVSGPRWTPASHYPGHRCCRYWASGIYTHILGAI
jgi:hypothetical protein